MYKIFLVLFLAFSFNFTYSQANLSDSSINMSLLKLGYSANFPGKDLKDRFGFTSSINARFEIKLKSQWIVGAKYDFLFGSNVSDSGMLKELLSSSIFSGDPLQWLCQGLLFKQSCD